MEKIEELRLINYLRHIGIPIKDIKNHLNNRNIDDYSLILENQLKRIDNELEHLYALKERLKHKLSSLEYIKDLPPFDTVNIEKLQKRVIIKQTKTIKSQIEWEQSMQEFEKNEAVPPSLIIGDVGFLVDLNKWESRCPTEFTGLFLVANDPFLLKSERAEYLQAGYWLTMHIKGDHFDASKKYKKLIDYARKEDLVIGEFALERTLIDHFISSDEDLYITEIQIPVIGLS